MHTEVDEVDESDSGDEDSDDEEDQKKRADAKGKKGSRKGKDKLELSDAQRLPAPVPASAGVLQVALDAASSLPSADKNGKSDPYVKLKFGQVKAQSRVVKASPRKLEKGATWAGDVQWSEDFELRGIARDAALRGTRFLELAVMDDDAGLLDRDDLLGRTSVDLTEAFERPFETVAFERHLDDVPKPKRPIPSQSDSELHAATVMFSVKWLPDPPPAVESDETSLLTTHTPSDDAVQLAAAPPPSRMLRRQLSVEDVLPTWLPKQGSLQEQMETIYAEINSEIRGQFEVKQGGLLNPLAPILGPIQAALYKINVQVRFIRRAISWEDRMLTFQLVVHLAALSVAILLLGWLEHFLPWNLIFEWLFRLIGLALLGPHMRWLGAQKRRGWAEFAEKSRWFEHASASERKAELGAWRIECRTKIEEAVRQEMDPTESSQVRELENKLAKLYDVVMLRPQLAGAGERYLHAPLKKRSRAFPYVGADGDADAEPPREPARTGLDA